MHVSAYTFLFKLLNTGKFVIKSIKTICIKIDYSPTLLNIERCTLSTLLLIAIIS